MESADSEPNLDGFEIDFCKKTIRVTHPPNVKIDKDSLESWTPFKNWKATLEENLALQHTKDDHAFHKDPYVFHSLEIMSIYSVGPQILSMKIKPNITGSKADPETHRIETLPAVTYLRGGNVAMLMILRPKDSQDEKLVVMTEQPRIPAGSLAFWEIPTGMLDDEANFRGAAAREINEETGFEFLKAELIDMTELALRNSQLPEKNLKQATYPSPGECDEYIAIFLWEKELDRLELQQFISDRINGHNVQGSIVRLKLVDYEDLWQEGARDTKTLAAWALYEGLSRAGILQEEIKKRKQARWSAEYDVEGVANVAEEQETDNFWGGGRISEDAEEVVETLELKGRAAESEDVKSVEVLSRSAF